MRENYPIWLHLKSLLLIAGFGVFGLASANHVLGGEITYNHISGLKYKFILHVYRNCNECEFNSGSCADISSLDVYASPEESTSGTRLARIALKKTGRKDITPLCSTVKSTCRNGSFPNGIEEWEFEGEYNFDTLSTSHCRFEIAIRIDSRLDAWSQGISEPFYNFARLNICNGVNLTSPQFKTPAFFLLPLNQSFTYYLQAYDSDGDSLSYDLAPAGKGFNKKITYPGAYPYTRPLDVFCPAGNCTLKKTSWPIEGIGIDNENGWLAFTPTSTAQTGFFVLEVTEWRKSGSNWVKMGLVRRDVQFQVADPLNHAPKIITSQTEYFACAGQPFSLDITINDPVYNSVKDSVDLEVISELPGGSLTRAGGSGPNVFDAFYSVNTNSAQLRSKPYTLIIQARDKHCPWRLSSSRVIRIHVAETPDPAFNSKWKICNQFELAAKETGAEWDHSWFLYDDKGIIDSRSSAGSHSGFDVPNPGKYYIRHQIQNIQSGCMSETLDSIVIAPFKLLSSITQWPVHVCKGETFTLSADFTGGMAPYQFVWDGKPGNGTHDYFIQRDSLIFLEITDSRGCALRQQQTLKIFPVPTFLTTDTAQCLPVTGVPVILNPRYRIIPQNGAAPGVFLSKGNGTITSAGEQFGYFPSGPETAGFLVKYTDSFGCAYSKSFSLTISKPQATGITSLADICSNGDALELDKATSCKLNNGKWSSRTNPASVQNNQLNPDLAGAGKHTFYYEQVENGCTVYDSVKITIHAPPAVEIQSTASPLLLCGNSPSIPLVATPGGGQWKSDFGGAFNGTVVPGEILAMGKPGMVTYTYTDPVTNCSNSDKLQIKVSPQAEWMTSKQDPVCAGSQFMIKPRGKNMIQFSPGMLPAELTARRFDSNWLFSTAPVNALVTVQIPWKITGLPGCADTVIHTHVVLKPTPRMSLTTAADKGCVPFSTDLVLAPIDGSPLPDEIFWRDMLYWQKGGLSHNVEMLVPEVRTVESEFSLDGCKARVLNATITGLETPVARIGIKPSTPVTTTDFPFFGFESLGSFHLPVTYQWTFSGGYPSSSALPRQDVVYRADTGTYPVMLTLSNANGCSSTDRLKVRVVRGLQFYAPNAFTPNNQGPAANEGWRIEMDSASSYHLTVRNKWGEILFSSHNQFDRWDGVYMGKPVPNGVYMWELQANTLYGRFVERKGTVSLIR
ncbi:MAG: gliding motility-associated C-terminal domain-containing protein [Bacteroidetes bacterium]|nr:gliding motility-associated C-terminal domain-containing protein [Bacteroidota bacterium]